MCKEDKQQFEPVLLRRRRLKSQQDVHLGIVLPRFLSLKEPDALGACNPTDGCDCVDLSLMV